MLSFLRPSFRRLAVALSALAGAGITMGLTAATARLYCSTHRRGQGAPRVNRMRWSDRIGLGYGRMAFPPERRLRL